MENKGGKRRDEVKLKTDSRKGVPLMKGRKFRHLDELNFDFNPFHREKERFWCREIFQKEIELVNGRKEDRSRIIVNLYE